MSNLLRVRRKLAPDLFQLFASGKMTSDEATFLARHATHDEQRDDWHKMANSVPVRRKRISEERLLSHALSLPPERRRRLANQLYASLDGERRTKVAASAAIAVLGIDAAWTETQPSGLALISQSSERWRCIHVAASYSEFIDPAAPPSGRWPGARAVLEAAAGRLGGGVVSLVAADIPLSLSPIRRRRTADQRVSQAFGAARCSTHSPSVERPGRLADRMRRELDEAGLPLATCATDAGASGRTIEVYPHPAVMALCGTNQRLEYKASKRSRYWPEWDNRTRIRALLGQWERILAALREQIDDIPLSLPDRPVGAALKRFEDTLDALVSAWVGTEYLARRALPYGDEDAAIWIPARAAELVPRASSRSRTARPALRGTD